MLLLPNCDHASAVGFAEPGAGLEGAKEPLVIVAVNVIATVGDTVLDTNCIAERLASKHEFQIQDRVFHVLFICKEFLKQTWQYVEFKWLCRWTNTRGRFIVGQAVQ